jgi:hypothetical protein
MHHLYSLSIAMGPGGGRGAQHDLMYHHTPEKLKKQNLLIFPTPNYSPQAPGPCNIDYLCLIIKAGLCT